MPGWRQKMAVLLMGGVLFSFWGIMRGAAHAGETYSIERHYQVGYRVLDFSYRVNGIDKMLTVAVWYPASVKGQPYRYGGPAKGNVALDAPVRADKSGYPMFVFSHGYGGGGLSGVFLTERLASRGWIVVAPDHHDSVSAVRIRQGAAGSFDRSGLLHDGGEISRSTPADRQKYDYRIEELQLTIEEMIKSPDFGRHIDARRLAVGGHSFGGFTALGVCGAVDRRTDPRVKALVLFSTGAGGYLFEKEELGRVAVPAMIFLGQQERAQHRGARTMGSLAEKVYNSISGPKYFLEIKGADHFSFNNALKNSFFARRMSGTKAEFDVISYYALRFLEKYVQGDNSRVTSPSEDPNVSEYREKLN